MSGVENPPAFPTTADAVDLGMTLRDWFAGQVLAGSLDKISTYSGAYFGPNTSDQAKRAYAMADAMLAARTNKGSAQ